MYKQKSLIYKLSRSKAPKHSKFSVTDIGGKSLDFLCGVGFSFRKNFANLGFLAKVSVSVESIIP